MAKKGTKSTEPSPEQLEELQAIRRFIQSLSFDENGPGTIVRDFQALLDFLGTEGRVSAGKHHLLPMDSLAELNRRMAQPIEIGIERPFQKSYPNLHGLYLLLRASGLGIVVGTGAKARLAVDPRMLEAWNSLNPTERYFELLDAWLLRGSPELFGERGGMFRDLPLTQILSFYSRIPKKGSRRPSKQTTQDTFGYFPGLHHLALLGMSGLLTVESGPPKEGEGWRVDKIARTQLGDLIFDLIPSVWDDLALFSEIVDGPEEGGQGSLQPVVQPLFPQWKKHLALPKPEFRDGVFVFRVSLGKDVGWRFAIPAKNKVAYLAGAILDATEFEDLAHLDCFRFKDRSGRTVELSSELSNEPPFMEKVRVGDLPLQAGESMQYIFDFGDWWEFEVKLERIEPPDRKLREPRLLESWGEPPVQYPDLEDEWDEDGEDEEEAEEES